MSFTFDDGPSPRFTPQVLALLARHDTPAEFCVIGQQAWAYPKLVRSEVKAGHRLCDHSRDRDLTTIGTGRATSPARSATASLRFSTPHPAHRYCSTAGPGYLIMKVVHAMHQQHLTPLRWTDDPRDWSRPGSEVIVRASSTRSDRAATLMRDDGGEHTQTVEALRWQFDALTQAG